MLTSFLLIATVWQKSVTAKPLEVGDIAPVIKSVEWIRGSKSSQFTPGHIYLVEFWATWCGPCISSMPHLAELQRKYANDNFHVMGITQIDDWGCNLENITKLINQRQVNYQIGIDSGAVKPYQGVFNGQAMCDYLGNAKVQAIPCSFLIDKEGRIAFIGLPTLVDKTLEQVVAGTFDIASAAKNYRSAKLAEADLLKYESLLKEKDYEKAYELGNKISNSGADARTLWLVAEFIVSPDNPPAKQDIALALKCAQAAVNASYRRDAGMLGTLAGAYYFNGELEKAKSTMTEAIELALGDEKEMLKKRAAAYGIF